jgi:regulator of sigma E protease
MTLIAFIVTIAILVLFHEYGHYQVARWCGVKVLKFSFGFGRVLYSKQLGQDKTEFALSIFPLGGFVKMLDEREMSSDELAGIDDMTLARAFNRQSVWKRIAIVIAGPLANLLLAVFLYWILYSQGVVGIKPMLGEIPVGSPAKIAQFEPGQLITDVGGTTVHSWQDVEWAMLRKSMGSNQIEITTRDQHQMTMKHHIDLTSLKSSDFEGAFMDKLGLSPMMPKSKPLIGEVVKGSVAEKAGLRPNDTVLSLNGEAINTWDQLVTMIQQNPGKTLPMLIARDKETISMQITPQSKTSAGVVRGYIGAGVKLDDHVMKDMLIVSQYSLSEALTKAFNKTAELSAFTFKSIGAMFKGTASLKSISGPITIANYAGMSAHLGIKAFIGFLAMISISLGVLNLLPIPVLDGGHLLYYIVEIVRGKPVTDRIMGISQRIGLSFIFLLMVFALFNDVTRLVSG